MLFSPKTTGAVVKWFIILTISAVLLAVASQAHCQTPADSLTSAPTSSPSTTVRFFPLYGQPIPNSVINVDSLREAVVEQQADSSVWITLTGYSDGIGVTARWTGREREVNAAGAQQRAQYVFDALVGLDADPQRISIRTAADSRQDMQGTYRRVEIGLRKMEPTVVTVSKTDTVVIVPPKPSLSGVAFNEDTIRVSAGVDVAVGQKYISCFWSDGDTTFGLTSGLQFTADRVFVNLKTGNLVAPQNADTFQVSVALASPFPTDGHVSKMTVVVLAPSSGSGGSAGGGEGSTSVVTTSRSFTQKLRLGYTSANHGMPTASYPLAEGRKWRLDVNGGTTFWNTGTNEFGAVNSMEGFVGLSRRLSADSSSYWNRLSLGGQTGMSRDYWQNGPFSEKYSFREYFLGGMLTAEVARDLTWIQAGYRRNINSDQYEELPVVNRDKDVVYVAVMANPEKAGSAVEKAAGWLWRNTVGRIF